MQRIKVLLTFIVASLTAAGQQNYNSMHSFYRDRMYFATYKYEGYMGNSFFPVAESEYNLAAKIADTTKQYYSIPNVLFKKHLLEFKGENYYLTISPTLNFARGRDYADKADRVLFYNTRGFFIEGDLMKNVSFSSSLYENQSRNPRYQNEYYAAVGELYPNASDSTYTSLNAVIPGGGRTKAFKGDGFDYGYAVGNVIYKPFKFLLLSVGNNTNFIGDGYRSMLLSDNSYSAPYVKIDYKISRRWQFVYLRSKLLNLTRRPVNTSVEAYYQPKGYAVNYLSFKLTKKLTASLFEGTIYSRGDSVHSSPVNALYYNPIPVVSSLLMKKDNINSILGLNVSYSPIDVWRFYGQLAYNPLSATFGGQLGTRISQPFKVRNLFIQLEGNSAPNNLYSSETSRLNYSHYNLPLAHTKGQGFVEGIFRINYEWNRIYLDYKCVYYSLSNFSEIALLPVNKIKPTVSGTIINNEVELGYRFNKKRNFLFFVNGIFRSSRTTGMNSETTNISFGIKTDLVNHYNDF